MRFLLHCYVCEGGRVRWTGDMGTSAFPEIFTRRPVECRYAVVETSDGEYWKVDLWEIAIDPVGWVTVGDYVAFSTLAAAVTAAQMTH